MSQPINLFASVIRDIDMRIWYQDQVLLSFPLPNSSALKPKRQQKASVLTTHANILCLKGQTLQAPTSATQWHWENTNEPFDFET